MSQPLQAAGIALALVRRVPANLSEGHGRFGKDRTYHYRIAYGSAKEVDVHLRLLLGAGVLDECRTKTALELFDSVRAMTWRLIHPRN
ncbi:MAG: four helix bundle protein [bacterium]|nr:four helix bundle protein [bacterium]